MKILFHGDSLAAFGPWAEYFPDHEIENLAMGGQIVEGVLARLEAAPDAIFQVHKVLIMVGINNLFFDDMFDLDEFIDNYQEIVKLCKDRATGADFYLFSILPVDIEYVSDSRIRKTNRALKEMADKEEITFVDLYSIFKQNSDYLTEDGVHLNEKGYYLWSKAISPLITEVRDRE